MKKLIFFLMIFISAGSIAFAKVEIVPVKDEFKEETGIKRVVYSDDRGAFALDFDGKKCIAIMVETDNDPYELENFVKFKIDDNMPLTLIYETKRGNRKVLKCYPDGDNRYLFERVLEKVLSGKNLKYVYSNSQGKIVLRTVPLKGIQNKVSALGNAEKTSAKIPEKVRWVDGAKQVWIDGAGWVYDSLIEK